MIRFYFQEQAQSATFSPDGSIIIVGCIAGRWLVMDSETREAYSIHTDGNEPIQVPNFSQFATEGYWSFFGEL